MLIYRSPDNPNPHRTAITRKEISFPTRVLLEKNKIQGRVLDFGCGKMKDLEELGKMGVNIVGYDPHYLNEWPQGEFDTILCHYVLNVLLPIEQTHVLMCIAELLKPGGTAYFTVRRDIQRPGFRTHQIHKSLTYQCNVVLPFSSIKKANHCEIYAYQHFPLAQPEAVAPFCPAGSAELITETASVYAIYSQQALLPGHALIIPKRPVADYFSLTLKEQTACTIVTNRVQYHLSQELKPDGFNLIVNTHASAGQGDLPPHLHLIPRYA
jgi:diadenosine tetraphosphate (Ap4A) HIT family hydrolase